MDHGIVLVGFIPQAWSWLIAFFLGGIASHAFIKPLKEPMLAGSDSCGLITQVVPS